jgi:hypothetical protein
VANNEPGLSPGPGPAGNEPARRPVAAAGRNETFEAYHRLFLNEAGGLKPDARTVLADLMNFSRFFKDGGDVGALPLVEGSRSTVRYILRMSGAGDQMLKRLLQGDDHEC